MLFPKYYRESNSNVHRGVYELAEEAENLYHHSERLLANTFNASEKETIFVRGATEGLNLLLTPMELLLLTGMMK